MAHVPLSGVRLYARERGKRITSLIIWGNFFLKMGEDDIS